MTMVKWHSRAFLRRLAGLCLAALCLGSGHALAQANEDDLRDLRIGTRIENMPPRGYFEFACGTNGGPPGRRLTGWAEFANCQPEPSGLHEVYVRHDDEMEFVSRVLREIDGEGTPFEKNSGTRLAGHPIILSVLFDRDGVLQGIRAVTDPRVEIEFRRRAFLLRVRVFNRYDTEGWDCVNLPPEEGQTPVGGIFLKQTCSKIVRDSRRIVVRAHFFRKPGQTGFEADGVQRREGEFESMTRFEILGLAVPPPR